MLKRWREQRLFAENQKESFSFVTFALLNFALSSV
jgi:hypothetical protein